jgi:NAD(P)-dependent dehydrogenase (short-subunit alcohol dehydrogenase family)
VSAPVALVTGGAGGIASAIRDHLLAVGWDVALADRDRARLEYVIAGLGAEVRGRVSAHEVDVTDERQCRHVVAETLQIHKRLDGLVNNAGLMLRRDADSTTAAEWRHVLDVNLTGVFLMAQAAKQALLASPHRAIVSMSSTHAFLAAPNSIAYSVSKAGVSHLTRLLALEWAVHGIRVNAVAPTVVPSPMTADVLADPAYVQRKLAAIPLGRTVAPEHVAAAVAYLLSADAGSTTGQTLVLDGGESLA